MFLLGLSDLPPASRPQCAPASTPEPAWLPQKQSHLSVHWAQETTQHLHPNTVPRRCRKWVPNQLITLKFIKPHYCQNTKNHWHILTVRHLHKLSQKCSVCFVFLKWKLVMLFPFRLHECEWYLQRKAFSLSHSNHIPQSALSRF